MNTIVGIGTTVCVSLASYVIGCASPPLSLMRSSKFCTCEVVTLR